MYIEPIGSSPAARMRFSHPCSLVTVPAILIDLAQSQAHCFSFFSFSAAFSLSAPAKQVFGVLSARQWKYPAPASAGTPVVQLSSTTRFALFTASIVGG